MAGKTAIDMDRRILLLLLFLSTCSITLSLAAGALAYFSFDLEVTRIVQGVQNPGFAAVMQGVSMLGDGWMPVILAGAVTAVFVMLRRWLEVVCILATLGSVLLAVTVKILVARPRPPSFIIDPDDFFLFANQFSFPSGHVLFFMVFFGFLAILALFSLSGWIRATAIAACCSLVLLIGPSRIYIGAHWASDVIGSYLLGTLFLGILFTGYLAARRARNKPPDGNPSR